MEISSGELQLYGLGIRPALIFMDLEDDVRGHYILTLISVSYHNLGGREPPGNTELKGNLQHQQILEFPI